ncbi:MAG: hypothetical protein RLZZ342_158 [Candidatus Parcubacteria bacterium]|jgi:hypothetical protein
MSEKDEPLVQLFMLTPDTLRTELDNAHKYYLESVKMTVRIPVASATIFFAFMTSYGVVLNVGVNYARSPTSVWMGNLLELLAWIIPGAGAVTAFAFGIAQYAALEAMSFSAQAYLNPNKIRLGLPERRHPEHEQRKMRVRQTLYGLFFLGHALAFLIWSMLAWKSFSAL